MTDHSGLVTWRRRAVLASTLALLLLPAGTGLAEAQSPPNPAASRRQADRRQGPERAARPIQMSAVDARETHTAFRALLERHPPGLGVVLKVDPSLLDNEAYLSSYPDLAVFLEEHPEVRHNPGFFLDHVRTSGFSGPIDPRSEVIGIWRNLFEGMAVFAIFLTVSLLLIWLVRTLLDYRRWNRLAKVQADAHNKLLDRFGSNDDLLTYIKTPAGSRFLEAAPIPLDSPARPLGAPFGRILWSLQAGLVIGAAGIGLQYVSGGMIDEVAQPLMIFGVVATAVGVGFVVSAVASYLISRRLGLFQPKLFESTAQPGPGDGL